MRSIKSYEPQRASVLEVVEKIVEELDGVKNFPEQKFELLTRCEAAFSHSVPNSQLFEIKNIGKFNKFLSCCLKLIILLVSDDVIRFYTTPVNCQTPYETLDKTVPNLHIIAEAKRYNPDEDGVSAFPKSSTLVTGLKYRKKYKGHTAKTSWP